MEYFELRRESIVGDKGVHHFGSFGFHGVLFAKLVFRDILIVEVTHLAHH